MWDLVGYVSMCTILISSFHYFYQNITKKDSNSVNCALVSVKLGVLQLNAKQGSIKL